MKKFQIYRCIVQSLFLILTVISFFMNFKIAMLLILISIPLFGVFYCGWICPFGFIQDLFSKLGTFLGIRKRKMPRPLQKILVFSRYLILLIVFFITTDLIFSIMSFDPKLNFEKLLLGNLLPVATILVIITFSLFSLFFERLFCNYFCYEGAKYGLMSILRPFTIKRNRSTCINCHKCDNVCPMNIQVSKSNNLRSLQCINCFQCVSNCPVKDTLNYGKMTLDGNEKNKYLSILVVTGILLTGFLAYNISNGINLLNTKNKSKITDKHKPSEPNTPPSSSNNLKTIDNNSDKNIGCGKDIPDGSYTGTSMGFRGPITVKITIKGQRISAIEVVEHSDDMNWFNRANNTVPDSIIKAQSTDVDTVSGATYSSNGIKNAVKDALQK